MAYRRRLAEEEKATKRNTPRSRTSDIGKTSGTPSMS
jgi:hypothetical protein